MNVKELTAKMSLHDFEDKNNIYRDPYHGHTLEGPQINKLFAHLQELETEVVKKDESLLDYIDTFKQLKQLNH